MSKDKQSVLLPVKVITKTKTNKIVGWQGDYFKILLAVPPIKGKANDKLLDLLANYLQVSKNQMKIVRGHNVDKKYISLPGKVLERLNIKNKY